MPQPSSALVSLIFSYVTWIRLILCGVLFLIVSFTLEIILQPRYPKEIPRMGHQSSGSWAKLRNSFQYFTQNRTWIQEGYYKYGRRDVAFVSPASISRPDDIILPRSQIAWMMEQPDDVLSADEAHSHILHSPYNFLGRRLDADAFASRAVHRYLARHLPGLIPDIEDEVNRAVLEFLGKDTEEWKSVNIWKLWLFVVPRVTNRLLVGEPLCRHETFLKNMVAFVDDVVRNSFLLKMFPLVLHPLVGRLFALPNWMHWRRANTVISETVERRLHDMAQKQLNNPEYKDYVPPEDFLTWDIRLAFAEQNRFELDPNVISKRLLPIEFAAIHTTALTGHSWMLDVLSSPAEANVLETLRDEFLSCKPIHGPWTKHALSALIRVDSSIRESQRLSNFAATLIERQVIAPEGLHNPALGWTVPRGGFVTVNLEGTHHDEELYPGAGGYDPWRYSREREAWEAKTDGEKAADEKGGVRARGLGMVTTSDAHLAFGHGRHACPGRFFVAHELKLIMAAILFNYDVKMIGERPQPQWFGATIIPPLDACVEMRRRRGTV